MAPRMTNEELIAAEEAKLAEIRAKAEEKVQAQIAKTQARLAELQAKATERTQTRIEKLDELIASAKASKAKVEERIAKLQAERDELTQTDEAEAEQPSLVDGEVTDPDVELTDIKPAGKAKRDAA